MSENEGVPRLKKIGEQHYDENIECILDCLARVTNHSLRFSGSVEHVDLDRYMGVWYEIASYPQDFSRNCVNSQTTYKLNMDNTITALMECWKFSKRGLHVQTKGSARVVDTTTNAKLKVTFAQIQIKDNDYWIIDLDQNYDLTAVTEPTRQGLWIISRDRNVDKTMLDALLKRLHDGQGFDLTKLKYTVRQ